MRLFGVCFWHRWSGWSALMATSLYEVRYQRWNLIGVMLIQSGRCEDCGLVRTSQIIHNPTGEQPEKVGLFVVDTTKVKTG